MRAQIQVKQPGGYSSLKNRTLLDCVRLADSILSYYSISFSS